MASSSPKPLPPDRIELRPKLVIHRDENPELWERFSKVSPKRQGAFIMFMLHQSLANEKLAAMARTLMEGGAPLPREPLVPAQSGDVAQGVKEPPPAPVAAKVPVAAANEAAPRGNEMDALSQAFGGDGLESFLSMGR
jgi:hypothetical protein